MAFRIHNPNANDMKWLVFIPTAEMRRRAKDQERKTKKTNTFLKLYNVHAAGLLKRTLCQHEHSRWE